MKSFKEHAAEKSNGDVNEVMKLPDIIKGLEKAKKDLLKLSMEFPSDLFDMPRLSREFIGIEARISNMVKDLKDGEYNS